MREAWTRALAVGAATGSRSMMPLAMFSWWATTGGGVAPRGLLKRLANPDISAATALMAGGEVMADKFSFLPSRTVPYVLAERVFAGAVCGVLVDDQQRYVRGALLGGMGAALAAVALTNIRGRLIQSGVPNAVVGLGEDVVTYRVARSAIFQPS